jgi:hypothetical protein
MRSIQPPRLFRDFFSFILAQGRRENKPAQRAKRGKCAGMEIFSLLFENRVLYSVLTSDEE